MTRTFSTVRAFVGRHPAVSVFVVAFAVRAIVAAGIFVLRDGTLFLDDAFYPQMAADVVEGRTGEWHWKTERLFRTTAAFLLPLSGLFWMFGSVVLLGQLLAAVFGGATASLTVLLARRVVALRWAVAGGLIVALMPSQVLFSSLVLKDAEVWAVLVGLGLLASMWMRTQPVSWPVGAIATLVALLAFLREHTVAIAGWALVGASVVATSDRWRRSAVAASVALLVPLVVGLGIGASDLVTERRAPTELRAENAKGADTAIVDPDTEAQRKGPRDDLLHLPHGVSVLLLEPFPWQAKEGDALSLAALESLLWYPVLALALVGLASAWRARDDLGYAVILGCGIVLVYALSEGNLGTAYRHRGEVVWIVAVLAAVGGQRLAARRFRRSTVDLGAGDDATMPVARR